MLIFSWLWLSVVLTVFRCNKSTSGGKVISSVELPDKREEFTVLRCVLLRKKTAGNVELNYRRYDDVQILCKFADIIFIKDLMKSKIIVPTDLTEAAGRAIKQAAAIAQKAKTDLTLLHVLNDKSPSSEETGKILSSETETIRSQTGVNCEILIKPGNIFEVIPYVTCEHDYDLMVIGTHGIQGIKQMMFGANILKLVSKIPIPVLVVQENSPLIENFRKIILPVSSHEAFGMAVESVLLFAGIYDPEVHLYSIHKAGFDWPEQLLNNLEEAGRQFEKNKVKMIRVKEDQNVYSLGYAKQTLNYAHSEGADLICMMSLPSKEYYYFAQSDKETMLLNDYHLPILCSGGAKSSDKCK